MYIGTCRSSINFYFSIMVSPATSDHWLHLDIGPLFNFYVKLHRENNILTSIHKIFNCSYVLCNVVELYASVIRPTRDSFETVNVIEVMHYLDCHN